MRDIVEEAQQQAGGMHGVRNCAGTSETLV
jgi:hypothetical protein